MRAIYFDCFAGISGDMLVGALIDLGLDVAELERELNKLPIDGYHIQVSKVDKGGIQATAFRVFLEEAQEPRLADSEFVEVENPLPDEENQSKGFQQPGHGRSLSSILELVNRSSLEANTRERISAVFRRLGEAEASVHGASLEQIHFHEVGGIDAVVDIASAMIGLEKLQIQEIYSSPLHLGGGFVRASHGILPIPAPATAALLKGVDVYTTGIKGELVTPTGAAIITAMTRNFGSLPEMKVQAVGYGAGTRDREFPNVLRAYLGELRSSDKDNMRSENHFFSKEFPDRQAATSDTQNVIMEANIDDGNPQFFEHIMSRLFAAGALDVLLLPVHMKKNRPGIILQVLSDPANVDELMRIIFSESTTIGIRSYPVTKRMLPRQIITVPTRYGPVQVKVASLAGEITNIKPEYEDCRRLALEHHLPVKEIFDEAVLAARSFVSEA